MQTEAATSNVVWRGDALQYDLGEGPCLDAIRVEGTVISDDLAVEHRWPRWARAVRRQLGIEAMLSLLLFDSRQTFGALNIYAESRAAFDDDDVETAAALAGHLALALADAREIENWHRATINRTRIGQAEGILMERLKISDEQAFAYLRRISQNTHRKLAAVADDLVRTGRLPQPDQPLSSNDDPPQVTTSQPNGQA